MDQVYTVGEVAVYSPRGRSEVFGDPFMCSKGAVAAALDHIHLSGEGDFTLRIPGGWKCHVVLLQPGHGTQSAEGYKVQAREGGDQILYIH